MKLLRPLFRLIDLVREERAPHQIAGGVVVGLWLGLNQTLTLHWWVALAAAFVLRLNPAVTAVAALGFAAVAPLLETALDAIGGACLLETPALNRLWSGLYHAPVLTFTRFNNTLVMGALVVSGLLTPAVWWLAVLGVKRKGRRFAGWLESSAIGNAWTSSLLCHLYFRDRTQAPGSQPPAPPVRRPLRPKGIIPFVAAALTLALYTALFLDAHLLQLLERYGTLVNGSEVDVASLTTRLFRGEVELNGIQVSHHVQPMRNLVEIERITVKFLPWPLLRKKLIVEDVTVEGIHLSTRRSQAAEIPPEARRGESGPGLIDRTAPAFYTQVRDEFRDNPLRTLARLATGIDLDAKIGNARSEMRAADRLAMYDRELTTLVDGWKRTASTLMGPEELQQLASKVGSSREPSAIDAEEHHARQAMTIARAKLDEAVSAMRADADRFEKKLEGIDALIDEDVAHVRRKLGLPRIDFEDLSRQVLGPKFLTYLERVTYWADLARRRMPKGSRRGQVTVVSQERSRGVTVNFGKMSTYPAVLIRQVTLTSDPQEGTARGHVRGRIQAITSDPPILGEPFQLQVDASFPASGIAGAKLEIQVDHTGETVRETLALSVADFPLERWTISETPDLSVGLAKSKAALAFSAEFSETEAAARWRLAVDSADYRITSPYKQLESELYGILSPLRHFTIEGTLSGSLDAPELKVSSELGKRLAWGLKTEYKHTYLAIDDNMRRILQDSIAASRTDLTERYHGATATLVTALETRLKFLQLKLAAADEKMKRARR